jgi:hypothetical protein
MSRPSLSNRRPRAGELDWNSILLRAAEIVKSYDTGVTLRQLYYRLVSEGLIPNRQQSYKTLSAKSAAARREGWFPQLIDRTREIERYQTFESPSQALNWLHDIYRRDRTECQEHSIYIGVEKHGLTMQLMHWFGKYGIPVMALGGYSSQTFVDVVAKDVHEQGRPSVLIYAGDFDPSGMDIDRDFEERTDIFDEVVRVALTADIVAEYDLPPMPGKSTDSRSTRFMMEHGELVQVELDALPPEEMRKLYQQAIDRFWDKKTFEEVYSQETEETSLLADLTDEIKLDPWQWASKLIDKVDDEEAMRELISQAGSRLAEMTEED